MSEQVLINNYAPVPEIFFREKTGEPFRHCTVCQRELIDHSESYVIEKAFRQDIKDKRRDLIFEFVYCYSCMEQLNNELSKESRLKIREYFEQHSGLEKRNQELVRHRLFDVDVWLNNCIVKNKPIDEAEEFQIYAQCDGSHMLFYQAPYMLCGEAMDEIMNLLSNKTLDVINDFWAEHVDLPPEVEDIFKTRKPVFL